MVPVKLLPLTSLRSHVKHNKIKNLINQRLKGCLEGKKEKKKRKLIERVQNTHKYHKPVN